MLLCGSVNFWSPGDLNLQPERRVASSSLTFSDVSSERLHSTRPLVKQNFSFQMHRLIGQEFSFLFS